MTAPAVGEVFILRPFEWQLRWNGIVARATWNSKAATATQLALLRCGYSVLTPEGIIIHPGAKTLTIVRSTTAVQP